ncbi:hypothetical protein E0H73_01725 [Kribbella pittospori]|uniref:Uncharacterized protein n=1 Tax=Kribbella pittospori TaxID=722689 RepID=A0A4R0KX51_9ACTN|nr:hypothetical protein [Kribbella pittospori]TCC65683.1 hypothetical protein E0H73_01725 [Kribbella pittospori]
MRDLAGTDWEYTSINIDAPEHQNLARAVGRVAIMSAELESTVRSLFSDLMIVDEAWVVSQGESSDWLLKNCERIVSEEHRHEDHREGNRPELLPLLAECRAAFRERGTVIHSSWGIDDVGASTYIALSSKRFRDTRALEYSLAEINLLADRFAEVNRKIHVANRIHRNAILARED